MLSNSKTIAKHWHDYSRSTGISVCDWLAVESLRTGHLWFDFVFALGDWLSPSCDLTHQFVVGKNRVLVMIWVLLVVSARWLFFTCQAAYERAPWIEKWSYICVLAVTKSYCEIQQLLSMHILVIINIHHRYQCAIYSALYSAYNYMQQ